MFTSQNYNFLDYEAAVVDMGHATFYHIVRCIPSPLSV